MLYSQEGSESNGSKVISPTENELLTFYVKWTEVPIYRLSIRPRYGQLQLLLFAHNLKTVVKYQTCFGRKLPKCKDSPGSIEQYLYRVNSTTRSIILQTAITKHCETHKPLQVMVTIKSMSISFYFSYYLIFVLIPSLLEWLPHYWPECCDGA